MISLLIAVATAVTTQQALSNQQRYEKFLEQWNQRAIDQTTEKLDKAEKLLNSLKKRKTRGRPEKQAVRQEKKAVRAKIKTQKLYLTKLKSEKKSKRFARSRGAPIFHPPDLYVGSIGPFRDDQLTGPRAGQYYISYAVLQIIDENQMLVTGAMRMVLTYGYGGPIITVDTPPVLIRGLSTKGMVDEQELELGGKYFEVTGTQQYETASGTNTVFVLEPFDMTGIPP